MRLSSFLSEVPQRLSHCKRRRCDEIIAAPDGCHGQVQFLFYNSIFQLDKPTFTTRWIYRDEKLVVVVAPVAALSSPSVINLFPVLPR